MTRPRLRLGSLFLALALVGGCNEKQVKTTSISLKASLSDPFNLSFVESVEIYVMSADPTRPVSPPVTPMTTTTFNGLAMEIEAKDFFPEDGGADGGVVALNETRIRIPSNPFARAQPSEPASFQVVFQSKAAGTNPMKILVRVLKGTQVIATGTTTKTVQETPIITVTDEKVQVQVRLDCAADFACDTGNRAPVLEPVGNQTLAEGQDPPKTIDLRATDPDGNAVTFSIADAPRFMTLDAQANRITLAPGFGDAGLYPNVKIRVTDAGTPPLTTTEYLAITVTNTNRSPKVRALETSPVGSERCTMVGTGDEQQVTGCSLKEGESFTLSLLVKDDPEDTISSLAVSTPPFGSTWVVAPDKKSATFSWTANYDQGSPNPTELIFSATDNNGGIGEATVPVTITDVNRPPAVALAEAQTLSPRCGTTLPLQCVIQESDALTLNLTVGDDTGETIQALTMTPPEGTSFTTQVVYTPAADNRSATLAFTPTFGDGRSAPYEFRFDATDNKGGTTTVRAVVTVTNVNRAPAMQLVEVPAGPSKCNLTVSPITCTIAEGYGLVFNLTVSDPDSDTITLFSMSAPTAPGALFSPNTTFTAATFLWAPSHEQSGGPFSITFSAQDALGASIQKSLSVTVTNDNRPPTIALLSGTVGAVSSCKRHGGDDHQWDCYVTGSGEGAPTSLVLRLSATDPDTTNPADLTIRITQTNLPALSYGFIPSSRIFTFSPLNTNPENYQVVFEAKDNDPQPLTDVLVVYIHTNFANVPPTISLENCTNQLVAGEAASCTARVDDPDPRDTLTLSVDSAMAGLFNYDPATQTGNLTAVIPVEFAGTLQIDFSATDGHPGGVTTKPWIVNISAAAAPATLEQILIPGGRMQGAAFKSPLLYAVNGDFLLIYNLSDGGNQPVAQFLLPGAKWIRIDGDRLYLGGWNLHVFDIAGTNAVAPRRLATYGFTESSDASDIAVPQPGTNRANLIFSKAGKVTTMDLSPCPNDGGLVCPVRVYRTDLMGDGGTDDRSWRLETIAPGALVAVRQFDFQGNTDTSARLQVFGFIGGGLLKGKLAQLLNPSFQLRHTGNSGFAFDTVALDGGTEKRLYFAGDLVDFELPDGGIYRGPGLERIRLAPRGSPGQETYTMSEDLAPVSFGTTAIERAFGYTYLIVSVSSDQSELRVLDDNLAQLSATPLPGKSYQDLYIAEPRAFAWGDQTNLSVLSVSQSAPTSVTPDRVYPLATQFLGQPSTYVAGSQTFLFVPKDGPIAAYNVTNLPASTSPAFTISGGAGAGDGGVTPTHHFRNTLVYEHYLIGHGAGWRGGSADRRLLAVFDLNGALLEAPLPATTSGFEIPRTGTGGQPDDYSLVRLLVPFSTPAGDYLYFVGRLCVPDCAADGGGARYGAWLIQITPAPGAPPTLTLAAPGPVGLDADVNQDQYAALAITASGQVLLRFDGSLGRLRAFDIRSPATPIASGDLTLPSGTGTGSNPTLARSGTNFMLTLGNLGARFLAVSEGTGADGGLAVSMTLHGAAAGFQSVLGGAMAGQGRAYMMTRRVVYRIDVSDLDLPKVTGTLRTPETESDVGYVHVRGDLMFVAAGRSLLIYRLPQ